MTQITKQQSDIFWRLKALAIFTVFFAHMPYTGSNQIMIYLFNLIGMVGVPTFLILSGYFDYYSQSSLYKSAKRLFIPLFIWGLLTYIASHINTTWDFYDSTIGFLKWIYGCGSWLYFVPVLFLCKMICCIDNKYYQSILCIISLISISSTSFGIIPYNEFFTPYTNPLNFLIYFQIGRYLRRNDIDLDNNLYLFTSLIIAVVSLFLWGTEAPSFFSIYAVFVSFGSFFFLYRLAHIVNFGEETGKMSYVIYLFHLVPASILNRRLLMAFGPRIDFVKVPLVFAIVVGIVWCIKLILYKLNCQKLLQFLGYR